MLDDMVIYQNEPLVRVAHDIARWHHERYDGRGYPDGLEGDAIAFLLIDLLLYQIHQLFLLGIQQDGVHHPVVDDQRVKGQQARAAHRRGVQDHEVPYHRRRQDAG